MQSEEYRKQGNGFLAAGDLARAEAAYRQFVAAAPDLPDAHVALGYALIEQGRLAEAGESLRHAVSIDAGAADAHYLLGTIARKEGHPADAIEHFGRALRANPRLAEAHYGLGVVLRTQGELDEALRHLEQALVLKPELHEARLNKSLILLLRGNFAEGLELLENRLRLPVTPQVAGWMTLLAARPEKRRWRGEDLMGGKLLIWTEEGKGDCIMAMRYLPRLVDRWAGKLLVLSDPSLARLMRTIPGLGDIHTEAGPALLDAFDCHCPIMSLPYMFGTRADTIPGSVPYLSVPDAMREEWKRRLADLKGPKVGLVWSGNQQYASDSRRSLSFSRMAPLLKVPGISFVSLQKGEGAAELARSGASVFDPMDACEDFLDTAAVAANLDLVISVDTSVAHLAGALGMPVWLLNRYDSDWRWRLDREDSPWYPTMRIFRQSARGDWDGVMKTVAGQLAAFRPQ